MLFLCTNSNHLCCSVLNIIVVYVTRLWRELGLLIYLQEVFQLGLCWLGLLWLCNGFSMTPLKCWMDCKLFFIFIFDSICLLPTFLLQFYLFHNLKWVKFPGVWENKFGCLSVANCMYSFWKNFELLLFVWHK